MLAAAMKQADSGDPARVGAAPVLASMHWKGRTGELTMREDDHQLLQPMFVSVLKPGMKFTFPENHLGFETISRIEPDAAAAADDGPVSGAVLAPSPRPSPAGGRGLGEGGPFASSWALFSPPSPRPSPASGRGRAAAS